MFLLCFGLIQCNVNQTEDKLVFAQVVSENYFVFPLDFIENVVLLLFVKFQRFVKFRNCVNIKKRLDHDRYFIILIEFICSNCCDISQ